MKLYKWLIVTVVYVALITIVLQSTNGDISGVTIILYALLLLICGFATIYFLYKQHGRDAIISAAHVTVFGIILFFLMLDGSLCLL